VEPIGETVVVDPLDLESAAVRRDEARAAWQALGRLPGERRQAMVMRFVDELSTAEIAGVLGRSEGAVRVLIHRALKSVARDMGVSKRSGDKAGSES
jgi:RNA polymerase sigma-70 factor (ECF subfamily)